MAGFIIIAISLLYGYLVGIFKRVANQQTTKGIITNIRYENDNDQGIHTYRAFIKYTVDGKSHELKSSYKSSNFRSGDTSLVSFDKTNPQNSFIRPKTKHYIIFVIGIIVGVTILLNS